MKTFLALSVMLSIASSALAAYTTCPDCYTRQNGIGYRYTVGAFSVCIPANSGGVSWGAVPTGYYCPNGWGYSSTYARCLPQSSHYDNDDLPGCSEGSFWSQGSCAPYAAPDAGCSSSTGWWWGRGAAYGGENLCIPHDPPAQPSVGAGSACPVSWQWIGWGAAKWQCSPGNAGVPAWSGNPTCAGAGWTWIAAERCCKRNYGWRRNILDAADEAL